MGLHSVQRPSDGIHTAISYVYADATARNNATGFTDPDDLYKLAYQEDTGDIYILDAIGPENWTQVNGGGGGGATDDSDLDLSGTIGAPAVDTLVERMDREGSPGIFSGGGITDDGDGTVTVATLAGLIRATDSDTAALLSFGVTATGVTPTDNDITYIYVEYNGGSPQVVGSITEPTDVNTNLMLGTVHRSGTNLHITERQVRLPAAVRDLHLRFLAVEGLKRASGGVVGETGTRNITVTETSLYLGLDAITTLSGGFDSSGADTFFQFYRDGVGGWNLTFESQISNSEYDDGSGTLASLTGSRRGVHWVYIGVDDHVYVIVGRDNYTNSQAIAATAPSDLPPHMQENHAVLAAKIIIQNGDSSFQSLESAFEIQFTGSGAADHGDLTGLSDDDHTQYLLVAGTRAMTGNLDMGSNNIVSVGTVDGVNVSAHASRHERGGADEIDGDHLDIDFTPSNYTPDTTPAEAANVDDLAAHLYGIDTALGSAGGGGLPSIELLDGFSSGNRYDADSNDFAGVTTGFFFAALFEMKDRLGASGQSIWTNINFGVDGWSLGVESGGAFNVTIIDTGGGAVGITMNSVDILDWERVGGKHWLLVGQVTQNGANNDLTLWLNGAKSDTAAGTNPYAPVTDTAQIGAGAFGNVAEEVMIGGVAYYEGTLTDEQIRSWSNECFQAGDIVDDGLGWTIYSVKRGSPAGTWSESDGTGSDFTRTGSLTDVVRDVIDWG